MGVPLQLNTGKLLSDSYITLENLATLLSTVNTTVTTGNLEAERKSVGSVIQIVLFLQTTITTDIAATGNERLQIEIFRNNNATAIYDRTFTLVPFASPAPLASVPVAISLSFIDNDPSSGAPITGEPINYNIQFTAVGLATDDVLDLVQMELLAFEEIENPNELTLTTPLT